jgi:hypothetical protein
MPQPDCPLGYPVAQLREWLGEQGYRRLSLWMVGQTEGVCDGRSYDHEAGEYHLDQCAEHPHGHVVYKWDVARWLQAGPIID